jgi:hypothetical protein
MSADGVNWAIQYVRSEDTRRRTNNPVEDASNHYVLVATIARGYLQKKSGHKYLEPDVQSAIEHLYEAVTGATVPFAAQDRYEYWLLNDADDCPLALLQSTVNKNDMKLRSTHPVWLAMPAAQLEIQAPEPVNEYYVPPVNYRLEELIKQRAGAKPRAAWFERPDPARDDFPSCLISEEWDNKEHQQLCDLYIQRLAPRLLMTHGLSQSVRTRLEQLACRYVFDVDRFYPLYPEVIDHSLMNVTRVEARLRRANNA